jgi:exonuclease VII large subunit
MNVVRPLAATAVAVVLSLGAMTPAAQATAHAGQGRPGGEPCAQQQAQVDRAGDALARVTAIFAHQKTKVERLQDRLAAATTPEEQARIQARLDRAMTHKQRIAKDKKAQVQRLAKAQERLAACQAAHG